MGEVIYHKYVKTRKPHNCFGCAREFPKGSILKRESVKDCGEVFNCYICPDCEDYLDSGDYTGEEFCFGDLRDAVFERGVRNG